MRLLDEMRFGLVKEGIEVYKRIRGDIAEGLPFWPLGLNGKTAASERKYSKIV